MVWNVQAIINRCFLSRMKNDKQKWNFLQIRLSNGLLFGLVSIIIIMFSINTSTFDDFHYYFDLTLLTNGLTTYHMCHIQIIICKLVNLTSDLISCYNDDIWLFTFQNKSNLEVWLLWIFFVFANQKGKKIIELNHSSIKFDLRKNNR